MNAFPRPCRRHSVRSSDACTPSRGGSDRLSTGAWRGVIVRKSGTRSRHPAIALESGLAESAGRYFFRDDRHDSRHALRRSGRQFHAAPQSELTLRVTICRMAALPGPVRRFVRRVNASPNVPGHGGSAPLTMASTPEYCRPVAFVTGSWEIPCANRQTAFFRGFGVAHRRAFACGSPGPERRGSDALGSRRPGPGFTGVSNQSKRIP